MDAVSRVVGGLRTALGRQGGILVHVGPGMATVYLPASAEPSGLSEAAGREIRGRRLPKVPGPVALMEDLDGA